MQHHLLRGAVFLVCFFLATACAALGSSEASSSPARARSIAYNGAITFDGSGHVPDRVEELLLGRIPGVNVLRISGDRFQVRVRSTNMIGSQDPLWVIDGLPVEPSISEDVLSSIDPRQVSRIVVLRDAGSTAIYGTRGANGVIELTTRRGAVTEPPFPRRPPPPIEPPRNDPPADPEI